MAPSTKFVCRLADRPGAAVAALCALQIIAWTLVPTIVHDMPPLDVVEGYMWGREWQIASFKHPGMPSWILEASRQLTGAVGWPAYLASQFLVALTFLAVYVLGTELMDRTRALAGVLLLTGLYYFSIPTPELNHNVAQMPFWAGMALFLWRGRERGRTLDWMILGALAAGGLYAKLSTALLIVTGGLWLLSDQKARSRLASPGPWLGLGVFLVLSFPLVLHLADTKGAMLDYAAERGRRFGVGALEFVGAQLLVLAGAGALLLAAGGLRAPSGSESAESRTDPVAFRYLFFMTAGPLAISVLAAVLKGIGAKPMWGTPMLNLIGLLSVAWLNDRIRRSVVARLAVIAACLLVVLPAAYAVVFLVVPAFTGRLKKQNWPQAEISARLTRHWTAATGRPLAIIVGEPWVAGAVGIGPWVEASILSNADLALSPWVTPARLKREGALVVWEEQGRRFKPPGIDALVKGLPVGEERFLSRRFPNAPPIIIKYAILPPA
ncbi:MAG: glycosyltransferase family 39 protein [Hyphomicrobiaceae bacterium]|nr:MAG: glycosyltransferase family 39 protein [Hyphomicrobiaceae bacterium]